jgi:hypothetical protein
MTLTLQQANTLDAMVSMSLARVTLDSLRTLAPHIENLVQEKLALEVARLRYEADLNHDVVCDAAAWVRYRFAT